MQSEFLEIWQRLEDVEQEVATVMSMYFDAIAETELTRILNLLDIRTDKNEKFTVGALRNILHRLERLGLAEASTQRATYKLDHTWREPIMRWASAKPSFPYMAEDFRQAAPYKSYWQPYGREAMLREWRLAYYMQQRGHFQNVEREILYYYSRDWQKGYFHDILFREPDLQWVRQLPPYWQEVSLLPSLRRVVGQLEEVQPLLDQLLPDTENLRVANSQLLGYLSMALLLRADWNEAERLLKYENENWRQSSRAAELGAIRGKDSAALLKFEDARKNYRRTTNRRQAFPSNWGGILHLLVLLRNQGVSAANLLDHYIGQIDPSATAANLFSMLRYLTASLRNELSDSPSFKTLRPAETRALDWLVWGWVAYWIDYALEAEDMLQLEDWLAKAQRHGYRWYEMEMSFLLHKFTYGQPRRTQLLARAEALREEIGAASFIDIVPRLERWERALESLALLTQDNGLPGKRKPEATTRLVWWIDFDNREIEAREQTLGKGGSWSKGRKVAPKRIRFGEVDNMLAEDRAVAASVEDSTYYYGSQDWVYNFDKAVLALVGHPNLFLLENPAIGIEIVKREPRLVLEEGEEGLELRFTQDFEGEGVVISRESPTRYAVMEIDQQLAGVRRQVGPALRIPQKARSRVREVVGRLQPIVKVQSTLSEDIADLPSVNADTRIYAHLLPLGDGFKLELFVKPLPEATLYQKPGQGRPRLVVENEEQMLVVERDLAAEKTGLERVQEDCPALLALPQENLEWRLDTVEDCLNVLVELQPLRDTGEVVIEHPKGEKIRLAGKASMHNLSLQVQQERDWFELTGDLQVNEQLTVNFFDLLQRAKETKNGFIQLSDGDYLALTDDLRRRLQEMEALLATTGKKIKLHPLAMGLFDDFADELMEFEVDLAWRERLERMRTAIAIEPTVPEDFQADLRPYQREGYRWLMRLAAWGVGACLADDMGLGKTIQALAVLLARAAQGPALVVAPASVVRNWLREAHKFAPRLNPILLGPGDRTEVIESLGPNDLLLVSYGLLPFEGERLAERQFATIVIDEAQAIKNRSTKRSKAAMALQGDFKIVTTGTPIENHLGELWNLFNFLNPGLLGSHQRFRDSYAIPIERYEDKERREQLRRLLHPFILRRRKDEVLKELPAKTEVVLHVELSPEETAFYEALRQDALTEISQANGLQKRFQILAQLTRLRQAACHPKLVRPDLEIPSSKLELVGETIKELLDNGHKALIFSQFVRHLRLVEAWVREENIPYQYLDGQTPGPQRDAAVQAFQRGEGELFLISLKAGGTGLTLTAADYVLHLDPWWNPAVEDQASDRAHRIGQERPVTVYRFVAEHTIEEKIVQLHQEKRDLADSLLAGTEGAAALSTDELMDLIRGGI